MTDIALDLITGDIDLSTEGGAWVSGMQAIAQRLLYALRLGKGEWWLDEAAGLDIRLIAQKPYRPQVVEAELRRVIARVDGVVAVRDVTLGLDLATRALTGSATIETREGLLSLTAEPAEDGSLATLFTAAWSGGILRATP